jgi:hypothetical protein
MTVRKQKWTVRVINPHEETMPPSRLSGLWVEQLRYMDLVKVLGDFDTHQVLEFKCPYPTVATSKTWAEQQAERMKSFGINAAAAPQWST